MSDLAELRTLGPNCHIVRIGDLLILFSYETAVAFDAGTGWVASDHFWSHTTSTHIGKVRPAVRVGHEVFTERLASALNQRVTV